MQEQAPSEDDLDGFFAPRGIAVIGASPDLSKNGGRTFSNLPRFGYSGGIYPVNPKYEEILGHRCYGSVSDINGPVDLAVLCIGADRVPDEIRRCAECGIRAVVVFSAGFGADSAHLDELRRAYKETGVRLLGPNTAGYRVVPTGVFATSANDIAGGITPGTVAVIAQSGGLGIYFGSAQLRTRGIGTKYVIDTGSELDVDVAQCLEWVAKDDEVTCIALIIEGTRDGRRLAAAVRTARESGKPVLLLRTGGSVAAAAQVASHTGALAAGSGIFERTMRRAGAQLMVDETELIDGITIHATGNTPAGRRLGIVTPSGGYAILTLDAAERFGMELPPPVLPPTSEQMRDVPSVVDFTNPLDYTVRGAAGPRTLRTSLEWMLSQPNLDAVLLWQAYLLLDEGRAREFVAIVEELPSPRRVPLFLCGLTSSGLRAALATRGVLCFEEPTRLVRALAAVAPRRARQTLVAEPPPSGPADAAVISGGPARALLNGLDHVRTVAVDSASAVHSLLAEWGGRVVLKVDSETTAHKTEVGFVSGPLVAEDVDAEFDRMIRARTESGETGAPIVVQPFESGVELALGAHMDPTFGPTVMVATGGLFLELLDDAVFAPAPLGVDEAIELIEELRGAPRLSGLRGQPVADIAAAANALSWLSEFIAEHGDRYESVDVNPLIVRAAGRGAIAVDALLTARHEGSRP